MKKKFISRFTIVGFISLLVVAGCRNSNSKTDAIPHKQEAIQQYTCPMHPQVIKEGPGQCPVCGMDLVPLKPASDSATVDKGLTYILKPANEQVVASTPVIQPGSGTRIHSAEVQGIITYDTRKQTSIASRVSGRIERLLIKYNYQLVRKGQLIMEIYSPDVVAAQRELSFINQNETDKDLLQKAKQRLLLLGMQPAQIQHVLHTGKVLYRMPVYSSVNGYLLEKPIAASASITSIQITPSAANNGGMSGMGSGSSSLPSGGASMDAARPSPGPTENTSILIREGQYVNAGQSIFSVYNHNSLVAEFAFAASLAAEIKRGQKLVFHKTADPGIVYTGTIGLIQPAFRPGGNFTTVRVYLNDSRFQIGQLVTANIPIVNKGWWLPKSAVWQLGTQSVVFKKEGTVFVPKVVQTGIIMEGLVQITEDLTGWEVAQNAAYLVDSESFILINSGNKKE